MNNKGTIIYKGNLVENTEMFLSEILGNGILLFTVKVTFGEFVIGLEAFTKRAT